jgi:DNA repair protein RecO (recombination protein O)
VSGLYRDSGVVLRTIKLGEADRIVTVFTHVHGKVRAVAKGVRKTTSKFGARLEPTSHVALQCYRGRDLDVVTQVEIIESNRALREGYGLLTHAIPMLEAVDQVGQEREPNPALYRMLSGALRTLATQRARAVTAAFFWKLLSIEGFHPLLDVCARCGDDEPALVAFDVEEGGTLCAPCARGGGRPVSPSTCCAACSAAASTASSRSCPDRRSPRSSASGSRRSNTTSNVASAPQPSSEQPQRQVAWSTYGQGRWTRSRRQSRQAAGPRLRVL